MSIEIGESCEFADKNETIQQSHVLMTIAGDDEMRI